MIAIFASNPEHETIKHTLIFPGLTQLSQYPAGA